MKTQRRNRRIHISFRTRNREYHVRAGECMAVRDRRTGVWIAGHRAIGMRLRPVPLGTPYLGQKLEFYSIEREQVVVTSPVVDLLRPNRNEVESYGLVLGFAPDSDLVG